MTSAAEGAPEAAEAGPPDSRRRRRAPALLRVLGPGLVTGAADDDPSGVSTYSTAGAAFGFSLLWTTFWTLPLMVAVQLMCARIGMVTGRGLAGVLREHYPRWLLWLSCGLLLVANTVNIGADLGAMAAVVEMLVGVPATLVVPVLGGGILLLLVVERYAVIVRVFKWLTLALFTYVGAAVLAHPDWVAAARAAVVPSLRPDRDYLLMLLAIFGTGVLGVSVLAGSAALAIAEAAGWPGSMSARLSTARRFYLVMGLAILLGSLLPYTGVGAIRLLFWAAVLNGILAPPLIAVVLVVCNDERLMGQYRNGAWMNLLGTTTVLVMAAAAAALLL